MSRYIAAFIFLTSLFVIVDLSYAHSDQIAPLSEVEKVYAAPEPIGRLSACYNAASEDSQESLIVACDLFRSQVPPEGLSDLPRPGWSSFSIAYSLTSLDSSGEWVDRPYLYLRVRLYGPAGQSWEQTWATFHFDAEGNFDRRVKRIIPNESTNMARVIWEDWPIGSDQSAEAVLESALEN